MSTRPDGDASLTEFFEKKWSIQIAYEIGSSGASYSSLQDDLSISTSVLSKRLKTGEYLGLWTTIAKRFSESRSKQKYVVTQNGLTVLHLLRQADIPTTHKTLEESREKFLRARKDFLDAIEKQQEKGDLAPPWEESPEPTAEARESIQDLDIPESVTNPFENPVTTQDDKEDSNTEEAEPTVESDVQSILKTVIAAYPEDISEDELRRVLQTEQETAEGEDTSS